MPLFAVKFYSRAGSETTTEDKAKERQEHDRYWKDVTNSEIKVLSDHGVISLEEEGLYRKIIVEAESENAVRDFAMNDPAIKAKIGYSFRIEPVPDRSRAKDISEDNCAGYIKDKVESVIEHYKKQERKKKLEFFGWQMAILIVGVGITIVNAVPLVDNPWVRIVSSILGASVAVMTGLTQLLRAHELWVLFGMSHVRFDSELSLYKHESGAYSKLMPKERCQEFVKNFEALRLEAAQQSWAITAKKD